MFDESSKKIAETSKLYNRLCQKAFLRKETISGTFGHILRGFQIFFIFPVFWYCRIGYNVLTTKIAFFFIIH